MSFLLDNYARADYLKERESAKNIKIVNNDDLDTDKELTYSDKQLIRSAREDSMKLKDIRANMTDEEKRDIDRQVSFASGDLTQKREAKMEKSREEDDIDLREKAEFILKEKGY